MHTPFEIVGYVPKPTISIRHDTEKKFCIKKEIKLHLLKEKIIRHLYDINCRKVANSRPVYYSILDHFVQRSQYISIKIPLHKQSEKVKMCY